MKILFVSPDLKSIGGIQGHVRIFMTALKDEGVHVRAVERKGGSIPAKLLFVARFFVTALLWRPDFIYSPNINFSSLCFWAKRLLKIPYSITFHGIEAVNLTPQFIRATANANFIFSPFQFTMDNVIAQVPNVADHNMLFPNSFVSERFSIREKSSELLDRLNLRGAAIIGTVCRMSTLDGDNKGYRRVIAAMPEILRAVPSAKYVLVGGEDDVEGARAYAKELGIGDKVVFAGMPKDEEMADYYNLPDVFVLPSKKEGFPAIVLFESLACGVPVVGGDQPGSDLPPWNGEIALIAEADNPHSIAEHIITILIHKAPSQFYDRQFLRDRMMRDYGPEAYKARVKKILEMIDGLLSSRT